MEYTLVFNLKGPIQWHDEKQSGRLFKSPAGTTDMEWISTGLTFASGEERWVYWICHIISIALKGRKKVTKRQVIELVEYLVEFHKGTDLYEFEERRNNPPYA